MAEDNDNQRRRAVATEFLQDMNGMMQRYMDEREVTVVEFVGLLESWKWSIFSECWHDAMVICEDDADSVDPFEGNSHE